MTQDFDILPKINVAPVSPNYGYRIRNILEYILQNLLQTYKNINQ